MARDNSGRQQDAPEAQAEQQGKPGLEPPHPPNVNQVRHEPIPASHHDEADPAEAETPDE